MKSFLILCLSLLYLVSSASDYSVSVQDLLTPKVCSDGMVILSAKVNLPFDNINVYLNSFHISVTNEETEEQSYLWCFIQQKRNDGKSADIGCFTRRLEEGTYSIDKEEDKITFYIGRNKFTVDPFEIEDTFEVTSGKEIYSNEPDGQQELFYSEEDEENYLEYYLFEYTTEKKAKIHLVNKDDDTEDISFSCPISYGRKIECTIKSDRLELESGDKREYIVYIEDSNKEKKQNFFVDNVIVEYE